MGISIQKNYFLANSKVPKLTQEVENLKRAITTGGNGKSPGSADCVNKFKLAF
jgi:hypothetical protein